MFWNKIDRTFFSGMFGRKRYPTRNILVKIWWWTYWPILGSVDVLILFHIRFHTISYSLIQPKPNKRYFVKINCRDPLSEDSPKSNPLFIIRYGLITLTYVKNDIYISIIFNEFLGLLGNQKRKKSDHVIDRFYT